MPTISTSRSNPSVTPRTMFATRARVRPWIALAVRWSPARCTTRVPSATCTEQSWWTVSPSFPLGPWTSTWSPLTETCTPFGIVIGFFPILDIAVVSRPSPDEAEHLAADPLAPRLAVGQHAPGRRQDGHAHPAQHAGDLVGAHVEPAARLRHPPEPGDDALLARAVLQVDPEDPLLAVLDEAEVLDEALLLQELRDAHLQLRRGDVDLLVLRHAPIADPRQHVPDRVRHHRHQSLPPGCLTRRP